ncbi:MAG TPA: acyl-CoA dehydrogenase [Desulfotomaculum sp.]|nr:MAG: acyl-CoA dehydrogenase [Desulfotomaculum sp. BICA1-6]HBX24182.1 acyl-CoA dehydrogenase [Desulfotomaculum sp.]
MNFRLTEEQELIRKMCREFTEDVIIPRAAEMDQSGSYPYDIMSQMADLGMMGIPFPEEYGGSGGDWLSMNLCIEEISRGDVTLGAMLDVTTSIVAQELYFFGTEAQKQKWLVPMAMGHKIGSFGLTEPESGSDAGATRTTAVLDGDEWVINGTKQFITNIGLDNASIVIITARCKREEEGAEIINTFILPRDTPGFTLGRKYDKLGWMSSATNEIILENCRIPKDNLLGEQGKGLAQHLAVLDAGRISIGAVSVGLAQACYEAALSHARQRVQFGKPIYSFQGVSFKIADMAMHTELGRNMYLKAAWLKDNNLPHTLEAAYAKLFASEAVEKIASDALQIYGGYGYMNEYPVSRYYKSAKILQIVEGTSEIQRLVISRNL